MAIVYGAVTVLFAIYLILRISRMLGGTKTTVKLVQAPQPAETFSGDKFNTAPLPARSAAEIASQESALKSEWVTYAGATPPLKLLIQGQSYESYRRVTRSRIDLLGQENVERLCAQSPDAMADFNRSIIAHAYVTNWEGAQYPNGNAMPFTPENLVLMMRKDQFLEAFITNEAKRVSPPWPAGLP